MTPEEYERLPEVKAALKLVRGDRILTRRGSWSGFKHRLMELLGVPSDQFVTWSVPTEFMYAQKRVSGWSRKDAFRQIVKPTLGSQFMAGTHGAPTLFHGTLAEHVPAILEQGISRGEGWGGAGTSGAFLSGSVEGALYWAKIAYQREHGEKVEPDRFDRVHGREADQLIAVVAIQIPDDQVGRLRADEEQFEDVHADFPPEDWRRSLEVIGDVRFDGEIPPAWIVEVIPPSRARG